MSPVHQNANRAARSLAVLRALPRRILVSMHYLMRGDFRGLLQRIRAAGIPIKGRTVVTHYQSFPGAVGSSHSAEKLKALRLPPLAGKTFLDVGCNEGYFCGFAKFQGTARSVGLDHNVKSIAAARARFPECEFLARSWDDLPQEKFDVILLASALHYAEDQPALIEKLVDRLAQQGTLVLELGVAEGKQDEWVRVKRSIDERLFPTRRKLVDLLRPYAWKIIGSSVAQAGDPVPRLVVHLSRRLPFAYLLMQPPAYGKTTISNALFRVAAVTVVSGDGLLAGMADGETSAPPALKRVLDKGFSRTRIDDSIRALFAAGLAAEYVDAWLERAGPGDFAFEGFIPSANQEQIVSLLREKGYLPVRLEWERVADGPSGVLQAEEAATLYEKALANQVKKPAATARGMIDRVTVEDCAITLRGWAFTSDSKPAAHLAVSIGGRRIDGFQLRRTDRPDVVRRFPDAALQTGFLISIPLAELASDVPVTVYIIAEDEEFQLRFTETALWPPAGLDARRSAGV